MSFTTATPPARPMAWTTAAIAALALGALSPLGLASGAAADLAANAFGVRRPLAEATPLADLLARLAVLIPFGEMGARPHALAALAGPVGLALLVARLCLTPGSGVPAPSFSVGAVAVAAGAIVVALSRPFLAIATVRADLALDFALLAGVALLLESLRRAPARAAVGLTLAFVCGFSAGASWPVRAAAWPLGVALTVWALRRGQRWPLLAPAVFVAGGGIAFGAVVSAAAEPRPTAGMLFHQLFAFPGTLGLPAARAALLSTADDGGVLALLVAAIGCAVLLVRARAETILWMILWAGAAVASFAVADSALARLVLIAGLAAPIAAATAALAASFGRARVAAAMVITVVVALTPAVGGIGGALTAAGRASPGAVARHLDGVVERLTASPVEPTDQEAARWRRYARAVGAAD